MKRLALAVALLIGLATLSQADMLEGEAEGSLEMAGRSPAVV